MEKILVAVFAIESEAYQALSALKNDPEMSSFTVSSAALMSYNGERIIPHDGFDTGVKTLDDTAIGGLVGSILGIFGGPLGIIFGGSLGALIGAAKDSNDANKDLNLISIVSKYLPEGKTALVALVDERNEEGLDRLFSMYTMTLVTRLNAQEVRKQIEDAKKAEIAMEKEMKKKEKAEKKAARKNKK